MKLGFSTSGSSNDCIFCKIWWIFWIFL